MAGTSLTTFLEPYDDDPDGDHRQAKLQYQIRIDHRFLPRSPSILTPMARHTAPMAMILHRLSMVI